MDPNDIPAFRTLTRKDGFGRRREWSRQASDKRPRLIRVGHTCGHEQTVSISPHTSEQRVRDEAARTNCGLCVASYHESVDLRYGTGSRACASGEDENG